MTPSLWHLLSTILCNWARILSSTCSLYQTLFQKVIVSFLVCGVCVLGCHIRLEVEHPLTPGTAWHNYSIHLVASDCGFSRFTCSFLSVSNSLFSSTSLIVKSCHKDSDKTLWAPWALTYEQCETVFSMFSWMGLKHSLSTKVHLRSCSSQAIWNPFQVPSSMRLSSKDLSFRRGNIIEPFLSNP